jgi:hypothetical protein
MRKVHFASLVILQMFFAFSIFGQEKYTPTPNEEIYGNWTRVRGDFPRIVNLPGKREQYFPSTASTPISEVSVQIESKWVDSQGSVFYKILATVTTGSFKGYKFQELDEISESGNKWEFNWASVSDFDPSSFPTSIDPTVGRYGHYERLEK